MCCEFKEVRKIIRLLKIGRGRGIRTPDFLLPKQARYQAAPCPDVKGREPSGRSISEFLVVPDSLFKLGIDQSTI
jgi:hypothetical protein